MWLKYHEIKQNVTTQIVIVYAKAEIYPEYPHKLSWFNIENNSLCYIFTTAEHRFYSTRSYNIFQHWQMVLPASAIQEKCILRAKDAGSTNHPLLAFFQPSLPSLVQVLSRNTYLIPTMSTMYIGKTYYLPFFSVFAFTQLTVLVTKCVWFPPIK